MRLLGRLLFLLVLIAVAWLALRFGAGIDVAHLISTDREDWKLEYAPQATVSTAYVVDSGRWLEFSVPPNSGQIRILANASLADLASARQALARDPQHRWSFALALEVLARDGQPLIRRDHHFRADFAEWLDDAGRRLTDLYFLTDRRTPTRGAVLLLNLAGMPAASRVRLRLASADADLSEVMVRMYFPEVTSESRLVHLWDRLNERQKLQLAKGSVYPPELLMETEKRNLLRNAWAPAGPLGSRGIDFVQRELYVLREVDGVLQDDPVLPAGVLAGPAQRAVLPLPEGTGDYRLEFTPVDPRQPLVPARLRWYGPTPFERREFLAPLGPGQAVWRQRLAGGLLEVDAPVACAVRLFAADGGGAELTPAPVYQRLQVLDPVAATDYLLAHNGALPTPLRIDLRTLWPDGTPADSAAAIYAFLDDRERILATGRLPAAAPPSGYDAPVGETPGSRLSDPVTFHFSVPAGTARLRLSRAPGPAGEQLLALVQTRPNALPRQQRVPEDQFDVPRRGERIPAWFALRPVDHERRLLENRSRLVAVQPRPPEDRPELLGGDYQWQDYRPLGPWRSVALLTPREAHSPLRNDALANLFQPLPVGRDVTLEFPEFLGMQAVTPRLLWLADRDEPPFRVAVQQDGAALPDIAGRGRAGETALPPVTAGRHRLRIDGTPGRRFYLSHVRADGRALLRRTGLVLAGPLEFDYLRQTGREEFLTARLFQSPGAARGRLHIEVRGPQPQAFVPAAAWVFTERQADVRPAAAASYVLDGSGSRVDAGQPVVIPFPAGAPAGRYRIRITAAGGAGPAYLSLSRIAAEPLARRQILQEPEPRHD